MQGNGDEGKRKMHGALQLEKKKLDETFVVEPKEFQLKCLELEQYALDAVCHFRAHLYVGQCLAKKMR